MTGVLSSDVVEKLVGFIGYGPPKPEVVFLGIEEAGGGDANILARAQHFDGIEDLYGAHEKLERYASVANPFKKRGNPVQQWNTAAVFALALAEGDLSLWPSFWRKHLGRRDGQTFLMEKYPVPRSTTSFRVSGYRPNDLWRKRAPILKTFLDQANPRFVVAYGAPAHEAVADFFTIPRWLSVAGTPWSVGTATTGVVVARVGFFGQGRFDRAHVPSIAAQMRQAAGRRADLRLAAAP